MRLSTIRIKNYRLLTDASLDVHEDTTLIVGRNNTAKTSCITCISTVLQGKSFSYDDYPLSKRSELYEMFAAFMEKKISYEDLCNNVPKTSVEFLIDYSADGPEDSLGALSPFIIDVDLDTTEAVIIVENRIRLDETSIWNALKDSFYKNDVFIANTDEARNVIKDIFSKVFGAAIFAINPTNRADRQLKTAKELSDLFPFYPIPAERTLGEDGLQNNNSLSALISSYFSVDSADLDPFIAKEVMSLRQVIEKANREVQKKSDKILSNVVNHAIGFGYPNAEELKLGVTTQLKIDDQIKNQTTLSYSSGTSAERLPSTYNGLGYKNLIAIEFLLASFAKDIEMRGSACIPLLFIEEPESHMHPQMQHLFAGYIEAFLKGLSGVHIQTILTSHSAHIANTIDFPKVRYSQKTSDGVIYKNLNVFAKENSENLDFIKKYLTLSRCDLFFADKIILVEGASERILLPDMIAKCDKAGLFASSEYKLTAQYYAIIEIGGAFAYKFVPFADFLGIPCLILTDIDSMKDGRTKAPVSLGKTTSNATIKWWMRKTKGLSEDDSSNISLNEIRKLATRKKTRGKCHIEFQTLEHGLCGRSLEEAIMNVNRSFYSLTDPVSEESLEFRGKSKTDFALNLICNNPGYEIPQYIKNGLVWLNAEKVLE